MPLTNTVQKIQISKIKVPEESQRGPSINVNDLAGSIKSVGLINPIVVYKNDYTLLAGRCRLEACKKLGWTEIPVHFAEDLTDAERQVIELEENIKRHNLHWKREVYAVDKIHKLFLNQNDKWTLQDTANKLSIGLSTLKMHLRVAQQLAEKDETDKIHTATSLSQAFSIIKRRDERIRATALARVDDQIAESILNIDGSSLNLDSTNLDDLDGDEFLGDDDEVEAAPIFAKPEPKQEPRDVVQNISFLDWAAEYSGPKFNLIHCDFPYGINHHKSDSGGTKHREAYDDSPEVYTNLVKHFIEYQDNFVSSSAHCIFWFSMKFYVWTMQEFTNAGWFVNPMPLIWHKTDNKGIVSDPVRRPRHIYETAFLMTRGDRKIIQPVADVYGAPTAKSKAVHISEKPVTVVKHFFRMCCDELSLVLDPTCGSGSALRAAYDLKAQHILGLEINPEFAEIASNEFAVHAKLAKLTEV